MTETGRAAAVARFVSVVTGARAPDEGLTLLEDAVLEIAAAADPEPDPRPPALAEVDRLARGVDGLDALVRRLWSQEGFAGDTENYRDPRNSSLAQVLVRRRGIPLTLGVLAVAVGRRAGVGLEPVGMPGHVVLRRADGGFLDPFTGRLLDAEGCEALFRAATGADRRVPFDPSWLAPIDTTTVLVRMLANLRASHLATGALRELRWVLEMRLALPGVGAGEVAELAEVMGRRAEYRRAGRLLDDWAELLPADAATLHRRARTWRARLN